ncbi:MAG TPA: STAS domain-containing protein [Acidobacteriota bacterium]|nr:STAS domain-containing protein [Acidobacteriota bacterium]
MDGISISLLEDGGNRDVSAVRVDGVIDTLTASELEEVIDSLLKRSRYKIVIDLAGVDYISSAGWGIFISHIRDVRANGGDIILADMNPDVYEIFELLEFDNVLKVFGSTDAAIDSFGGADDAPGEKKKGTTVARQVVAEAISSQEPGAGAAPRGGMPGSDEQTTGDLEVAVCRVVRQDPFVTVAEIRRHVNSHFGGRHVGWWRIVSVLRKKGLLSRRSRFRYAWGRS